ncbi:hypothetical protein [Clostridium botulinum]
MQFKEQQSPNTFQNITIKKVGLGIVIGQNTADSAPDTYSICKITGFNVML